MKSKILKLCIIILSFSLMGAGCEKDDVSHSILNGKWILLGFGDNSTGEFISEPESEPKSSYVVFDNGELNAYSVTNKTYEISYNIESSLKTY
ncbi:MAG TPA: hypothetical protein ENN90_14485 [Mariniphaga anaerophila]|uniref:Lipocalin-like domain-containing protein n=1 Tax=Mariniphaga anaerophila TaxID=1484053 RepID=A0A831LTR5_9BACT|nr:hypothetical protein [Mariniphaga anaerophila]